MCLEIVIEIAIIQFVVLNPVSVVGERKLKINIMWYGSQKRQLLLVSGFIN
jgi:hypothetical protein